MRKYIVFGCGGFVGSHLLDKLLADPDVRIVGFDLDYRKIGTHLERPNFRLFLQDLHEPEALELLRSELVDADAVINLAAICNPSQYNTQPLTTIRSNFLDIYPIIKLCVEANTWLMHFSTSEVYGRTVASYLSVGDYSDPDLYELDEDETPLIMGPIRNQRWTYACAKQLMERLIFAHHKEDGLRFTVVRPLNFFGPRMDFIPGRDGEGIPRVLACFMTALLDRQPMLLVDGGRARRTIVSIHDAIRAISLMLEQPERSQNQIFNVGNRANEVTIEELALLMRRLYARITGDPSYLEHPIRPVSREEFYGEGYEDCDRRVPSLEKARMLLGWEPEIGLEALLTETMQYYHDQYGGSAADAPPAPLLRAASG